MLRVREKRLGKGNGREHVQKGSLKNCGSNKEKSGETFSLGGSVFEERNKNAVYKSGSKNRSFFFSCEVLDDTHGYQNDLP